MVEMKKKPQKTNKLETKDKNLISADYRSLLDTPNSIRAYLCPGNISVDS